MGEKEDIIINEEKIKTEIEKLSSELETLKACEVEMRKKEMRKSAELKVNLVTYRQKSMADEFFDEV